MTALKLLGTALVMMVASTPAFAEETVEGVVKWYNQSEGYGFLTPESGGKDVFVHVSAVEDAGMDTLIDGECVRFRVEKSNRDRPFAENLAPCSE